MRPHARFGKGEVSMENKCRVTSVTQKDKNRIKEHGDIWFGENIPKRVSFDSRPHVLLTSKNGYLRWWVADQVKDI